MEFLSMRNRKLVLTLLALAVLIVGVTLLLRQTNTQNDTSMANNDKQPKTEKPTKTDPEKAKKSQPSGNTPKIKELQKGASQITKAASNNNSNVKFIPGINKTPQSKSKPALNNETWKAKEIIKLKNDIQQETNPAYKAKLQKRLNSLQ